MALHTDLGWVRLYVGRWLRAPVERSDGTLMERTKGTPQGGVVSPLLANLFLHYAFDLWMQRKYPGVRFERYADDAIVHCRSEEEARSVLEAIRGRLAECGLELHPERTRVVYRPSGPFSKRLAGGSCAERTSNGSRCRRRRRGGGSRRGRTKREAASRRRSSGRERTPSLRGRRLCAYPSGVQPLMQQNPNPSRFRRNCPHVHVGAPR